MPDPRITKLAKLMVHYSLKLKPGQQVVIRTHPLAEELTLATYEEAIKAGAFVTILSEIPGSQEIFYKYASDAQLEYIAPIRKIITETFDASLSIWSEHNTHSLSGIDPARKTRVGFDQRAESRHRGGIDVRHHLHRMTTLGYEGSMYMLTTLVNAVLERLDEETRGMGTTDYNYDLVR